MEDLSLLGNAAAVPIIIAITQFLKKTFSFKRRADIISLITALLVCFGWDFYNATAAELYARWGSGGIVAAKAAIDLLIVSFATWLSASKSYDLFIGEKKREKVLTGHLQEKETLKKEIEVLKNGGGAKNEPAPKDSTMDSKLRDILEGR